MKTKLLIILLLLITGVHAQSKKGILVVSFGSTFKDTRELCIESIENKIKKEFPNYEVRRAFTSRIVRRILDKRDRIYVSSPEEALSNMVEENFDEIYVQPLHIIPGSEYEEIVKSVNDAKTKMSNIYIGKPLFYNLEDYYLVINALQTTINEFKKSSILFVGHGTTHPANAVYSQFQNILKEKKINAFVSTIEGYPTLDLTIKQLKKRKVKNVILMPLMLVAGEHAKKDISGKSNDSWKSILLKEGFNTKVYLHGLGENKLIRGIYVNKLKELINKNNHE